ncbi:MAG: HD domain-containing protein [Armatimonadetes bacterium]|nr:HD domain-containing protein [Armatimonadota bacterium]
MQRARHLIETVEQATEYLWTQNAALCGPELERLNLLVLSDVDFWQWPAATKRHQAYEGGLAVHTAQVAMTALWMLETVQDVRKDLVYTACLWHDSAKTLDYERVRSQEPPYEFTNEWANTPFHEQERHVARSYADFRMHAHSKGIEAQDIDFVSHLILAHHGRREWGSPVEPVCAEAWAIHAADMLSARFLT